MPSISKQSPKGDPTRTSRGVFERVKPISFEDTGIKCLLYGRSGTGKTTLWGTFPGPILAMICSGSTGCGELRSLNTQEMRKKVSFIDVETSEDARSVAREARGTDRFKTFVLDHASGFQDKVLSEILGLDELPAQMSWGTASQQQYGQCTLRCKELLKDLLSLDANVVIIAQERTFGDETGEGYILPTVGAGLAPSLTSWLNTAVDYICNTFIRHKEVEVKEKMAGQERIKKVRTDEVEYCLRTAPHAVYTTKFRVPKGTHKLPDAIPDPSYAKLIKLING